MQPHERVIAFDLVGLAAGDIERLITVDKARVWREAIVASPVSRFRRQLGEDGWHRGPRRAAQRVTRVVAIASQSRDPAGRAAVGHGCRQQWPPGVVICRNGEAVTTSRNASMMACSTSRA